ncbi:MAG: ferredoxin family protein [Alphaproteobacteria bacterium]|nr:ferredoxin family protein [Alphaproteobacteria bacterium]TAD90985.1 MAG: ferredoxin family protein [Alphaproteobacteria bacterium]
MTTATDVVAPRIAERLSQNRYLVDEGRPHIRVIDKGKPSPALLALVTICPAGCYSTTDEGKVEVAPDGCQECGTCRVLCADTGEIDWNYPRGGYGVLFKFG